MDIEMIREKLATDNRWLVRGIVAIYERQTFDEQQSLQTSHDNGVGFNGVDANIMSSFAQQIQRWEKMDPTRRYPNPLSDKQLAIARKKMGKYAKQLAAIAEAKTASVAA